MQGEILYPLNELKQHHVDAYNQQIRKYEGREALLKNAIPTLNCLWNDVLHLAAVHPEEVKTAMSKAGLTYSGKFFQIDPHSLEPKNTTIYLYKPPYTSKLLEESDFVAYDPDHLHKYSHVGEATIEDYRKRMQQGKRPFVHVFVPHILYKGTIDTSNAKIIEI